MIIHLINLVSHSFLVDLLIGRVNEAGEGVPGTRKPERVVGEARGEEQ